MCFQLEFGGVDVSSVYVHSAKCDTYLVQRYFIDVLSIGVEDEDTYTPTPIDNTSMEHHYTR